MHSNGFSVDVSLRHLPQALHPVQGGYPSTVATSVPVQGPCLGAFQNQPLRRSSLNLQANRKDPALVSKTRSTFTPSNIVAAVSQQVPIPTSPSEASRQRLSSSLSASGRGVFPGSPTRVPPLPVSGVATEVSSSLLGFNSPSKETLFYSPSAGNRLFSQAEIRSLSLSASVQQVFSDQGPRTPHGAKIVNPQSPTRTLSPSSAPVGEFRSSTELAEAMALAVATTTAAARQRSPTIGEDELVNSQSSRTMTRQTPSVPAMHFRSRNVSPAKPVGAAQASLAPSRQVSPSTQRTTSATTPLLLGGSQQGSSASSQANPIGRSYRSVNQQGNVKSMLSPRLETRTVNQVESPGAIAFPAVESMSGLSREGTDILPRSFEESMQKFREEIMAYSDVMFQQIRFEVSSLRREQLENGRLLQQAILDERDVRTADVAEVRMCLKSIDVQVRNSSWTPDAPFYSSHSSSSCERPLGVNASLTSTTSEALANQLQALAHDLEAERVERCKRLADIHDRLSQETIVLARRLDEIRSSITEGVTAAMQASDERQQRVVQALETERKERCDDTRELRATMDSIWNRFSASAEQNGHSSSSKSSVQRHDLNGGHDDIETLYEMVREALGDTVHLRQEISDEQTSRTRDHSSLRQQVDQLGKQLNTMQTLLREATVSKVPKGHQASPRQGFKDPDFEMQEESKRTLQDDLSSMQSGMDEL
jgi:hypothetical protein